MKKEDILKGMSYINEDFIEAAEKYCSRRLNIRKHILVAGSVAACCCILFSGLYFSGIFGRHIPSVRPDPVETDKGAIEVVDGYKIDSNGVLLGYTGNDTDLVLPDSVKTITNDSFSETPNIYKITSVTVGNSVSKIEENAFGKLTALKRIDASEDNPYCSSNDGILKTNDGTVYFAIPRSEHLDLFSYIEVMQKDYEKYSDVTKIVVDEAVLNIEFKDLGLDYDGNPWIVIYITSARVFGYEKVFDEPMQMYGNFSLQFHHAEDVFIIAKDYYGAGPKFIFTPYGIEEITDHGFADMEKNYNESIITITTREDGKIGYIRRPVKYIPLQCAGEMPYFCVSRDEFAREEGYMTFENGKIGYVVEKTFTVSEVHDMESEFEIWYDYHVANKPNEDLWPEYSSIKTLDDLIEYNKTIYEEAK